MNKKRTQLTGSLIKCIEEIIANPSFSKTADEIKAIKKKIGDLTVGKTDAEMAAIKMIMVDEIIAKISAKLAKLTEEQQKEALKLTNDVNKSFCQMCQAIFAM